MELIAAASLFAYHRGMIEDTARVDAYREAIAAVVNPGDVVVDVGTGTGLLAFFAAQAGARHVYAIEQGPIVALARELCAANGLTDRVTFIHDSSLRATLPELADVLVTETLWNFGIGEGLIGFLNDAKARLLKPDARIIPTRIDLFLAPIEHPALYRAVTQLPRDPHGLNYAPMRAYSSSQVVVPVVDPAQFIAAPAALLSVDLVSEASPNFSAEATFHATRSGEVHALAGWFDAELAPGIHVGNEPPDGASWAHAVYPLERSLVVEAGDEIAVRIDTVANGTAWRWSAQAGATRLDQTSLFGFPRDFTAQQRRAVGARPERAPLGDALRFVLDRLDGTQTVEVLADGLSDAHPGLFAQPGAAAEFVRDCAERYGI